MKDLDLALWEQQGGFLSRKDVEYFRSWGYAFRHDFEATDHSMVDQRAEESRQILYHAFIGLRIIRPPRRDFAFIQGTLNGTLQVNRFSHPEPESQVLIPESEKLGALSYKDALRLKSIADRLHSALTSGHIPIVSSVRNLEAGYASRYAHVQQLLWASAIDSLVGAARINFDRKECIRRVLMLLANDFSPYDKEDMEFQTYPQLSLTETLEDVYKMRDLLAHGGWVPDIWLDRQGRRRASVAGEWLSYADVLREVTSSVLRASLERVLSDPAKFEFFKADDAREEYFSRQVRSGVH